MDESYELSWEDATAVVQQEEVISDMENVNEIISAAAEQFEGEVVEEVVQEVEESGDGQGLSDETISTVEETPLSGNEENIMYITEDDSDLVEASSQEHFAQEEELMEVTQEEVITEYPQEIIIGSEEAVGSADQPNEDVEIPLASDQDEYTAARPYPCDFCSRRFRKKTNLMDHMVAHRSDRPHGCNLCGVRYIRKSDLMNHLKTHAYIPEGEVFEEEENLSFTHVNEFGGKKKKPRPYVRRKNRKSANYDVYDSTGDTASSSQSYVYPDNVKLMDEMDNTEDYFVTANDEEVQEIKYPVTDPKKPFVCQHCGVSFAREKALASHSRIHGGDSPFECQKCGEMFWDSNKVKQHLKEKHGDMADFDLEEDEDYSESEEVTKYGTFYCTTCGLSFHRQDNLRRHQRIHVKEEYLNEQEVGHICNVCGESFQEALDLLAHAEVHARGSEFRCMVCGEVCVDENILAAHVQALHAKTLGEHSCLLCGRTCKDSKTLMKHSWEHSKEKVFSCNKCSKTFHNKARLKRHMLSHRNKVVVCEECGEEFPDGRSLMNHRHSHSSVSGRQFPCRECGKTFGSRSSQQIHIRIHTGERPYGCRFCWKAFADGGTLRKHERIHTGEKPYACAVCPRAFNQRVVLREHIRSHHSGPDPKYTHSMTPYCCAVCSDMFATSQDLILHLIHHCDLNTAMKRQPQVGPRKYKRRRKLKPHELELISSRQEQQEDMHYDQENDNDQFETEGFHYEETEEQPVDQEVEPPPLHRRPRRNSRRISTGSGKGDISDSYEQMLEGLTASAAAQQQTDSIEIAQEVQEQQQPVTVSAPVTRGRGRPPKNKTVAGAVSPPTRPKMIHTQKTKISIEMGEDGKMRQRTRTMITRTQPAEIKSSTGERIRPRTKNVSYHIVPDKLPTATFTDSEPQQAVENLLKQADIEQQQELASEQQANEDDDQQTESANNGDVVDSNEPSVEENVQHLATEHGVDTESPVPMNIIKVVSRRVSTRSVTKANSTQIIGGQKVRIVKSGMLITKPKRNSESVSESEATLSQQANDDAFAKDSLQIFIKEEAHGLSDEVKMDIKSEELESQNVKQEMMDPSALHELAEISMRHGNAHNLFRCEMCSEVFTDKNQLLMHVPVHI